MRYLEFNKEVRVGRQAVVRFEELDVRRRLAELGIVYDVLVAAESEGTLRHRFAPAEGFPGHAEYVAASYALAVLRTNPSGRLTTGTHLGIPVAFNGTGTIAIGVTTGDLNCGIFGEEDPRSTTIKGPNTARAGQAPRLRLSNETVDELGVDLWQLLSQWLPGDERRFELSHVAHTGEDGRISGWHERLILSPEIKGPTSMRLPDPRNGPVPFVKRRAS